LQSVGTENFGSRVSVGGTGYLLGIGYVHVRSTNFRMSAGIAHLSSHLTRDLDEKVDEERLSPLRPGGRSRPKST
jgi:hypothetical protein